MKKPLYFASIICSIALLVALLSGCTATEGPSDDSTSGAQDEGQAAPPSPEAEDGEDEEDPCFIATASYGTDTADEIDILREFRDEVLLSTYPGSGFVSLYYRYSPPVARFISERGVLKTIVREGYIDPIVLVLKFTHGAWSD